jgi:double-stranded uracil-DNA glycosylase
MSALLKSFPAAVTSDCQILILGSLPGEASLVAAQYYAHPRNAFWPIMQALFGVDASAPYRERLAQLNRCGVGLWDVIGQGARTGSLDSAIDLNTAVFNDMAGLFAAHPTIRRIATNGGLASKLFKSQFQAIKAIAPATQWVQLPSTSPANARLGFEAKREAWREGLALR